MTTISEAKAATSSAAESPEAKLKAAVSGKSTPDAGKGDAGKVQGPRAMLPVLFRKPPAGAGKFGLDLRVYGIAGAALALGTLLGAGATAISSHRGDTALTVLGETNAGLEANRVEAARLNGEIETMTRTLTALRDAGEGTRADLRSREASLAERMSKLELGLSGKVAALGDRLEQGARDQSSRLAALTAQIEKRPSPTAVQAAAPAVITPTIQPKAEPSQTGAIPDTKKAAEKPPVIEGWALRDVYEGTAVLEDRRRRLFEAVLGENIPGVGRVEAIERRGREWVVVTRQGVITSQSW